jgi:hypothetical protein
MKWVDGLRKWRKDRNLTSPSGSFIVMVEEELREYETLDPIDAIGDIIVLAVNELELEGYNVELVMKQIVKHISCRKQDPIQSYEWSINGPSGKWQKDLNQDPSTIHQPDFSTCKLITRSGT